MNKTIIGLLLLLFPIVANADVLIHLGAYHPTTNRFDDNRVYGVGYQYMNNVIGIYNNSLDRNSMYAAKEFSFNKYSSVLIGAVTGYTCEICPLVTFNLKFKYAIISILPINTDEAPMGIMFSLRI